MKRSVRERVAGARVEEDGEDVDGAERELIVVALWRGDDGERTGVT